MWKRAVKKYIPGRWEISRTDALRWPTVACQEPRWDWHCGRVGGRRLSSGWALGEHDKSLKVAGRWGDDSRLFVDAADFTSFAGQNVLAERR